MFWKVKRKCPTCGRVFEPSEATQPFRPFCSARCRAADLGKWLNGGYRIASPLTDEADLESGAATPEPQDPDTGKLPH
jgi:endogenous inhibitor of DNA gyrase (YacG/DUF329 family)